MITGYLTARAVLMISLGSSGSAPFRTGNAWHAGLGHRNLGADLVAHQANRVGARADEDESALLNLLREVGVFGKNP